MTASRQLRPLLIVVLVFSNILMFALAGYSLHQTRQQYELRAETQTQNVANALDQSLSNSIEKVDMALRMVTDELEHQLAGKGIDEQAMNVFLTRQEKRVPEVEAFRIASAEGLVILGKGVDKEEKVSWADRDYFIIDTFGKNHRL